MSSTNPWPKVSKERPCRKCGKHDNCTMTIDGERGHCFRDGRTWHQPRDRSEIAHDDSTAASMQRCLTSRGGAGRSRTSTIKGKAHPSARAAAEAIHFRLKQEHPDAELTALYEYGDAFAVVRIDWPGDPSGKACRPVRRDTDGWRFGDPKGPLPLYGCESLPADPQVVVYVVEGEKAAEAAKSVGLVAVTSSHGSGQAHRSDWSPLDGRAVVILPDNDDCGEKYASDVATILLNSDPKRAVKIAHLRDLPNGTELPKGGDMADVLEMLDGKDDEDIQRAVEGVGATAEPIHATEPTATQVRPRRARYEPFPVELLPGVMRQFVEQAAAATGCDTACVALPALAVVSASIGTTRRVRLKSGWSEFPIIWPVCVMESGGKKTPAFNHAIAPLKRLQQEAAAAFSLEEQEHRMAVELHKHGSGRRKKGDSDEPDYGPLPPTLTHIYTTEPTTEALAPMLRDTPRGILLARDELSGWIGGFDAYKGGRGADAASWLEHHSGGSLKVDRKGGGSVFVPCAAVWVCGTIQPNTLRRALGTQHVENGMAARMLLAAPTWRAIGWTDHDLSDATAEAWDRLIRQLRGLSFAPDTGCERGEDRRHASQPVDVPLTPEALDLFRRHCNENAAYIETLAVPAIRAVWSKLEATAARLALALHGVRSAGGEVTSDKGEAVDHVSMAAGISLAHWFGREAQRVYAQLQEDDEERDNRELLELIERKGGRITANALRQFSRQHKPSGEAETALTVLVNTGHGRWASVTHGPQGGRPTREFVLGPSDDSADTGTAAGSSYIDTADHWHDDDARWDDASTSARTIRLTSVAHETTPEVSRRAAA